MACIKLYAHTAFTRSHPPVWQPEWCHCRDFGSCAPHPVQHSPSAPIGNIETVVWTLISWLWSCFYVILFPAQHSLSATYRKKHVFAQPEDTIQPERARLPPEFSHEGFIFDIDHQGSAFSSRAHRCTVALHVHHGSFACNMHWTLCIERCVLNTALLCATCIVCNKNCVQHIFVMNAVYWTRVFCVQHASCATCIVCNIYS